MKEYIDENVRQYANIQIQAGDQSPAETSTSHPGGRAETNQSSLGAIKVILLFVRLLHSSDHAR